MKPSAREFVEVTDTLETTRSGNKYQTKKFQIILNNELQPMFLTLTCGLESFWVTLFLSYERWYLTDRVGDLLHSLISQRFCCVHIYDLHDHKQLSFLISKRCEASEFYGHHWFLTSSILNALIVMLTFQCY